MSGNATIFDELAEVLTQLRQRFGNEAFADRRRMLGFIADYLPESRREMRIVATLLDEGTVSALERCAPHLAGIEMDRQTERLESGTGMNSDIARQSIRAFAYAMEKGPKPSSYETIASASPVDRRGDEWAGLSQAVEQPHSLAGSHRTIEDRSVPLSKSKTKKSTKHDFFAKLGGGNRNLGIAIIGGCAVALGAIELIGAGTGASPDQEYTDQAGSGYAGELTDYQVLAKDGLESNVGSPTPLTIPGGTRVTTAEVEQMLKLTPTPLLIDVLDSPHETTIKSAVYLPSVGAPGAIGDRNQPGVKAVLDTATNGDKVRPLVFFCAGAQCWESYNAVLRAKAAQYRRLYWYRGGLASWSAAGLPMERTPAPNGQTQSQNNYYGR